MFDATKVTDALISKTNELQAFNRNVILAAGLQALVDHVLPYEDIAFVPPGNYGKRFEVKQRMLTRCQILTIAERLLDLPLDSESVVSDARQFISTARSFGSRGQHCLDAIAVDGTAWVMYPDDAVPVWQQVQPLPEVA
jgi:hypothetical protein